MYEKHRTVRKALWFKDKRKKEIKVKRKGKRESEALNCASSALVQGEREKEK